MGESDIIQSTMDTGHDGYDVNRYDVGRQSKSERTRMITCENDNFVARTYLCALPPNVDTF